MGCRSGVGMSGCSGVRGRCWVDGGYLDGVGSDTVRWVVCSVSEWTFLS